MQPIFRKFLIALCSCSAVVNLLAAASMEDYRKKQMIEDLEVIKHNFEAGYAPIAWKKEKVACDLGTAFENARNQILSTPGITTKQFHNILRQFVNTTQDYHVDVMFYSTEAASLPFSVRGAEGRYFIDWIDALRLSPSYYPVHVGDELIQFDERPIADVISELAAQCGKKANEKTDQRLAEIKLTQREGMTGDLVPKGPVMISTRSAATGKVESYQLHWTYTPERIANPLDFLESLNFYSGFFWEPKEEPKLEIPQVKMASPLHEAYAMKSADRAGGLGAKKSFLPPLGETLWEIKDAPKEEDESLDYWNAYVYRHPNGKSIGYIRIPHYHESQNLVADFGKIINILDEKTDALVIDQVHNFGGFVDYMYQLASILAIEPLKAPYHRIKITQKEVMGAHNTLELIKLIDMLMFNPDFKEEPSKDKKEKEGEDKKEGEEKKEGDDVKKEGEDSKNEGDDSKKEGEDSKKEEGKEKKKENLLNYQELMFLKSYYELILEEWNRGEFLTRPTPILGVDRINPHPKYHYTKPILILIDEMDFSGGDFMPAILQDNRRAVLFGSKTAGAGGFVTSFQFPNPNGIWLCSYTGSIAERPSLQKIENVGVTPDIQYQITPSDIQGGYQGYVNAVNEAVQQLLE